MTIKPSQQTEPIPGYVLVERLGQGGFGEVWKAVAPGGIPKAIKFVHGNIDDDFSHTAAQELKSLNRMKSVHHPFILGVERVDVIDGQVVIVMELADRDLMNRLQECQKQGFAGIPREELLRYMDETAEALDLMNAEHNLQHLDIKPQNLFLVRNHIKVADFGLAKDFEGVTASLSAGITPMYAAPETFEARVSRFCDQYSLAIVFQEMLTGKRPFNGTNARALLLQHVKMPPDLTPLPPGDHRIVERALAKDPSQRWPTCTEFVQALRAATNAQTVAWEMPAASPPTPAAAVPDTQTPGRTIDESLDRKTPSRPPRPEKPGDPAQTEAKRRAPRDEQVRQPAAPTTVEMELTQPDDGQYPCPRCGAPLADSERMAWCLKCGYYDLGEASPWVIQGWQLLCFAGIALIAGLTYGAHGYLPVRSWPREVWGLAALGLAVFGLCMAHLWAMRLACQFGDGDLRLRDVLRWPALVWRAMFHYLPGTHGPICLAIWSVMIALSAVALRVLEHWPKAPPQ
ncbi:MAG: serine/threonine protein kinase [Planctomycetia bacterium]|nr:serine/threonine protein kinase [Planctomycetia bacterium]